jgi:hypothetical protein
MRLMCGGKIRVFGVVFFGVEVRGVEVRGVVVL